jgi:hypothetical protein
MYEFVGNEKQIIDSGSRKILGGGGQNYKYKYEKYKAKYMAELKKQNKL